MPRNKVVEPVDSLPPRTHGSQGIDWDEVCREVEAEGKKSDRWCKVGTFTASVATHIRRGKYPSVDPEKFEVTTQRSTEVIGKSVLYMRLRKG